MIGKNTELVIVLLKNLDVRYTGPETGNGFKLRPGSAKTREFLTKNLLKVCSGAESSHLLLLLPAMTAREAVTLFSSSDSEHAVFALDAVKGLMCTALVG